MIVLKRKWILLYKTIYTINIIKSLDWIVLGQGCSNLGLSPPQIEELTNKNKNKKLT